MFENIYIVSTADVLSGGVSSMHNLCKSLIVNNYNAKMFYVEVNENLIKEVFSKRFNVPRSYNIEDNKNNLLIVPEVFHQFLDNYGNIHKIVYWLSLKFFFKNKFSYNWLLSKYLIRKIFLTEDYFGKSSGLVNYIKISVLYRGIKNSAIWNNNIVHLTNSYYIYSFCKFIGAKSVHLLYNPLINEIFTKEKINPRSKKILIGPRTSKILAYYLIKSNPGFEVIRLKRLAIENVYALMSESMVYADFTISNRDRTPREAALLGCIVFTSNKGSAGYSEDVPIPDYYKIDGKWLNYRKINKRIKYAINNYEESQADFSEYKNQSITEKENFNESVNNLFQRISENYFL